MKSNITRLLHLNRALLVVFLLLVAQQLIVASSTIWIARLITHIHAGEITLVFLGLYLASLLLPYFPGASALIQLAKAKASANVAFVCQFAETYRGQIVEWSNFYNHSKKASLLTGEAPQTINGYFDYIYHFASCGLNVGLNLIALAWIVDPLLIVAYAGGMALALLILIIQKRLKRILSLRAQQGRVQWTSMLLKAWDNILLNNAYNFQIWLQKTAQRGRRFIGSSLKLEGYSQGVSVGMAFVLLGPSFALICYLAVTRAQDIAWLSIMVVSLPRLFQVLSYSYELLFVLADFPMQVGRLQTVFKLLEPPDFPNAREALENRIQWDKITVIAGEHTHLQPQQLLISLPSKGRFTLRGENGSGKTSLLLLIKMLQQESAYYLPSKHELIFQISKNGMSTGQQAKQTLQELLHNLKSPIILLDEWDANLDSANAVSVSTLIGELAQNACVLESRHQRKEH